MIEKLKGDWEKYKGNPILSLSQNSWDSVFVRDAFIIKKRRQYYMFYTGRMTNGSAIGLAISEDGFKFKKTNCPAVKTTKNWEANLALFGSVIKHKNEFILYYNGGNENLLGIGAATSIDLIHWRKHKNNPIWCTKTNVSCTKQLLPFVIFYKDKYFMYTESLKAGWGIDVSISCDPYRFVDFNTVWTGAKDLNLDKCGAANPKVFIVDGMLLMGYNGFDYENPGNLRFAVSEDGINWKPFNDGKLILQKKNGEWDGFRTENAFLLFDNDIKLYYFGSQHKATNYRWDIGVATLKDKI